MARSNRGKLSSRFFRINELIALGFAGVLAVFSLTASAQEDFGFEDPLADTREKIERTAVDAGRSTWSKTVTGNSAVDQLPGQYSPKIDVKGPITVFAERVNMPVSSILGLGLIGFVLVLFGPAWLLLSRRKSAPQKRRSSDLYAVSDGARARRVLESGASITRNRKNTLDTREYAEMAKRFSGAQQASFEQDEAKDAFDEFVLDEEIETPPGRKHNPPGILGALGTAAASLFPKDKTPHDDKSDDTVHETVPFDYTRAETTAPQAVYSQDDPAMWKRPNLERLKASIKNSWEEKEQAQMSPETAKLHNDAKAFAGLFAEDDTDKLIPQTAHAGTQTVQSGTSVLNVIDFYDQDPFAPNIVKTAVPGDDKKAVSVDRIPGTAVTDKMPDQDLTMPSENDGITSRADALRRIRALRESVQAS